MMANKSLSSPLCITCKARKLRSNLCYVCNRAKELFIPSGNKVIDDFISYTLTNSTKKYGNMIFVPYDNFKNIEFIGEGGKNSYDSYVNVYYGITQDPTTQDLIFIMPYYDSDLTYCITKYFFKINWHGTSKSATENDDNNNIYGIIPYVAPECWHPDPEIRPTAVEVSKVIHDIRYNGNALQTKIIKSSDVGPATIHNPGAIYKSRYLSNMIKSAATTRSLRSQSITSKDKRKFEDNNQSENNFDDGDSIKKTKLTEDENNDYVTKEIKFDIDTNSKQPNDEKYITREIGFDI
ncbi:kinase-like domain-containing protein [Rhizophagus irregularis DAOM 181602=DAOM 197198]|nr:kinase-like domain-containing protein [Rhizophagus irregularis DAOM 181602=DAOM 197198]